MSEVGPAVCEISVVMPVLNGADTISEQLDAVLAQDGVEHFEVVVVDNGSTDGTVELVTDYAGRDGRVRLLDGATLPKGGAAAKNLGVRAAKADLIAFCDADDVVRPGWLRAIRESLRSHPVVVVTREYVTLNPHLSSRYQIKTQLTSEAFGAPSIAGGAFGIRRDVYLSVGGFDETFIGAVDVEFSLRLNQAGFSPHPVPDGLVSVRLRGSAKELFQRQRMGARSGAEVQSRHGLGGSHYYSWRALAKMAASLLRHSPQLLKPADRLAWAQRAGAFVGRLEALMASDLRLRRARARGRS